MSGTKHMSAGQAYGAGIYFASEFGMSLNYCGRTYTGFDSPNTTTPNQA